jgi:hypothetical protein
MFQCVNLFASNEWSMNMFTFAMFDEVISMLVNKLSSYLTNTTSGCGCVIAGSSLSLVRLLMSYGMPAS